MEARDRSTGGTQAPERETQGDEGESAVSVHRASADRVVFTDEDNADAWIATDDAVDLEP